MLYVNFGFDSKGNNLEYLGCEFETVEEIIKLCVEFEVSVTVFDEHGFKLGIVFANGDYSFN